MVYKVHESTLQNTHLGQTRMSSRMVYKPNCMNMHPETHLYAPKRGGGRKWVMDVHASWTFFVVGRQTFLSFWRLCAMVM